MNTNRFQSNIVAAIAMALIILSPLAIDIYLPAFNAISTSFNVDVAQLQDSITLFMISLGIGQLLAGPMADKYGRKPVAYLGISIYVISSIAAYLSSSIEMFLVARLMQGFGASATTVIAFTLVKDNFDHEKSNRVISYLNGAIACVPALAPTLGYWLTMHYGWRSNFGFLALFSFLVGLAILSFIRETQTEKRKTNEALISVKRYMSILKVPTFLFHATLCALTISAILAYITSAPIWLISNIGIDTTEFTLWFAANAVINILACVIAPKLMSKLSSRRVLQSGLILLITAGGLMQTLGQSHTAWGFMLPIFVASIGFAFVLGTSATKALAPFPDQVGTAAAMLGLIQLSGSGIIAIGIQSLGLLSPDLISLQLWLTIPALIIIGSKKGLLLHPHQT
ncbi:putative multidrug resistance protein [Vibrio ichthyoenteri ATCC 700023]|uniref:Bcr/CflA family efflux transporter n=1 Tax=Vibrio ichthyoenteri ATCC 700023 TaxID=870968 RepID=F9S7C9_9VIBR|nr:multidrug effflux MFS transporter [Vibrio ichthyoenteri]EGU31543.1 putative multidrug resistance protein [Vibrio ichthyoenteri ATCC 700023]